MSDIINLTITETEDVINLTITEESTITIGFYDLALPDARVIQARVDAQAAAVDAIAAQVNVQANATAATIAAAAAEVSNLAAGVSATEAAADALEVSDNLALTLAAKNLAEAAAVSAEDSKDLTIILKTQAEDAQEVCLAVQSALTGGTFMFGADTNDTYRFFVTGGVFKLQRKVSGVWTDLQDWVS